MEEVMPVNNVSIKLGLMEIGISSRDMKTKDIIKEVKKILEYLDSVLGGELFAQMTRGPLEDSDYG